MGTGAPMSIFEEMLVAAMRTKIRLSPGAKKILFHLVWAALKSFLLYVLKRYLKKWLGRR